MTNRPPQCTVQVRIFVSPLAAHGASVEIAALTPALELQMDLKASASSSPRPVSTSSITPPSLTHWMYWDDEASMPAIVHACIMSWKRHNPTHKIQLVTDANVEKFVKDWPKGHDKIAGFETVQKKSNWIRMTLLETFGGIWIDASAYCLGPVERWVTSRDQVTLYSQRSFSHVLENWAIGAPRPRHPLIVAWRAQLRACHGYGREEENTATKWIEKVFAENPDIRAQWAPFP